METGNSTRRSRRVVITGVGVVSPLGIGAAAFAENLRAGKSGIRPLSIMSYSAAPQNVGGEVADFTEDEARKTWLKPLRKSVKVMCREIQMGVASAALAIEHAGLNLDAIDHERLGVDFGANLMFSPPAVLKDACWSCIDENDASHTFHYERWGQGGANAGNSSGMGSMEPLWLLRYLPNMPACHIAILADARGPSNSLTLDEASGNLALGEAARVIGRGQADAMIAGTTGTRLHPVKTMHAALWDELADSDGPPESWSRPFEKHRTGQVLAEGACSLLLEDEAHARARGATVLGTILGGGSSCVLRRDGRPDIPAALASAMRSALSAAGIGPGDVGHVNAHGLGTRQADSCEAAAIREVFGPRASDVPVTALKSALGNSGSGCGPLELAGSLLLLADGLVPVTLNYETPDADCPLNVVRGRPAAVRNRVVLKLNVTRLGQASALVVQAA